MKINRDQLNQAIQKAFDDTALRLDLEFKKQISATTWDWPRGESPRDIIDTGRLRASQSMVKQDAGGRLEWRYQWPLRYAASVHDGSAFTNGSSFPARPWTRVALREFDVQAFFDKSLASQIRRLGK